MLSDGHAGAPEWLSGDIAALFAGFETASSVLLAVSGGPDSMALLHLAAVWRAGLVRGPALHVATVDHGLRDGARAEADLVSREAEARGLPHTTLIWTGDKPEQGLQEKAREARYRLLADHARSLGIALIVTAHHADDQAETVLMRLGRGSGVTGLAAMRREAPLRGGVTLVRPLLALTKGDLLQLCEAAAIPFAIDPSNENSAYLRTRLRQRSDTLAALGLDRAGLVRLARRMARADEALEAETDRLQGQLAPDIGPDRWAADLGVARDATPEILLRLLGRALRHVGGRDRIALEKLEVVADALRAALGAGRPFRGTMAGALIALTADGLLVVTPEPPRGRRSRPD